MITHIVLFKLISDDPFNVEKTKFLLMSMKDRIPQLRHIEVGMDVLHSDRSYDLALITKFDSMADMEAYQVHPQHMEISKEMRRITEASASVDYECD